MENNSLDTILDDIDFLNDYLDFFAKRLTLASVGFATDSDAEKNIILLDGALNAINYIFKKDYEKKRLDIICEVAKLIEPNVNDKGFRRTAVIVKGSNVKRSGAKQIYPHMYSLLDNYYNMWQDLDPYLREAYFHIILCHIHPFEDGNGRVARILTASNLVRNGETPFVIGSEVKEMYNNFIENSDFDGMADLFKELSTHEDVIIKMR